MGAAAALPGRWRVFPSRSAVALRAEPPGSHPINQKPQRILPAAAFPLQHQNAYGGLPEKLAIRRVVASSLPFVCYIFQSVYFCVYCPFCISFIRYLPLFGSQTDLFSQKNPAFLPYRRLPLQRFHLPVLTSAQRHATPLSVYCRFCPAFQARSVLFYLKYTNCKAKCRQLPVFSLKESWFILSLLYLSLWIFVYVSFYF